MTGSNHGITIAAMQPRPDLPGAGCRKYFEPAYWAAGAGAEQREADRWICVTACAARTSPSDRSSDAARIAAGQAQGMSRASTPDLLSGPGKATGNRRGSGYHHGYLDRS